MRYLPEYESIRKKRFDELKYIVPHDGVPPFLMYIVSLLVHTEPDIDFNDPKYRLVLKFLRFFELSYEPVYQVLGSDLLREYDKQCYPKDREIITYEYGDCPIPADAQKNPGIRMAIKKNIYFMC